ncbi:MAG: DegT/DnrJ/EryC1/StrS family aminotransferase [Rickettsiales bacterium]
MRDFIPFALPDIGDEEINAVVECMRSGWLTTGPVGKKFEEEFSEFIGEKVASISVNSATMGLMLALEAVGVVAGDEVIVPTYTFSATAMVAVYLGAKPVLCDIDPITMNIDPKAIEAKITKKTKAIIPVHFAGLACDMDAINAIAKKHHLKVIEDAAHSLPTEYKGKLIGSGHADATVYSFYATKTITTGEGGMIVTKNPEIAQRCRVMRLHGISRDAFDRYTSKTAKWYYEIVAAGAKCNLTDIASSIGREQLKKAYKFAQRRKQIAMKYIKSFQDLPLTLPYYNDDLHAWHLFVIRIAEAKMTREAFIEKMTEKGIGCSVHFIPLHLHPFYQEFLGAKLGDFPNAESVYKNAVSLPIYTKMTDEDVDYVIKSVREILC